MKKKGKKKSKNQSVLIVRDTSAAICQVATGSVYLTELKKGHRLCGISKIQEEGDVSLLKEPLTGTLWGIPTCNVIPLAGRFKR